MPDSTAPACPGWTTQANSDSFSTIWLPKIEDQMNAARCYLEQGWMPVPIPRAQKAPRLKKWQDLRLTETDLPGLFNNSGNIGLLLGVPSRGLVDVDLDVGQAAVLAAAFLPATDRKHGRKSKPGSHWWYVTDPTPEPKKFSDADGTCLLELRSTGQQTVVPPSIHPSGESVVWEADGTPAIATGDMLLSAVSRLAAAVLVARHWPGEGVRHEVALALAGFLLRGGWSQEDTDIFVSIAASAAGDEEYRSRQADVHSTAQKLADGGVVTGGGHLKRLLGEETVSRLADWLFPGRTSVHSSDNEHRTDLGNAGRLVTAHGKDLRFCHTTNKWLVWDGTRWQFDTNGEVERRAKQTVLSIYAEVASEGDEDKRKALAKWAAGSESRGRINAMIELAKSESGIPVAPEDLDSDPWLLNCANGTIDLRTGQLQAHRREDLCTKLAAVRFEPTATCPLFEGFLDRIMGCDFELAGFVQRSIGYALTGSVKEQAIFIWYGSGANGKTTLIEAIRELLGDYAKTADSALLLSKKSDGISNNIARLAGARFVSTSETEAGRRLDETQVKQLTGGDTITARFLYAEFFEFAALFKLFLATNHRPKIRGTDKGIWRRIRLVPFNVTIPDEQQDKELKDKLRDELPGILAWAVRGSLAWQNQGLGIPPEVREATESYRCDMDVVGRFISERCIPKAGIKTPVSKLYGEYVTWCEENGEEPLKKGDFGHQVGAHGFSDDRDGRTRYRVGIGLVTDVTNYDADFLDSSEFEQSVPNLSKQSSQASPSSQPMEAEVEVEL